MSIIRLSLSRRRPLDLHLHLQAGHGRKRLKRTRCGLAHRPADERQRQRRLPQVRDDRDAAAHAQEVSGAGGPVLPGELHAQPTDRLLLSKRRSADRQTAPKKPFRGGSKPRGADGHGWSDGRTKIITRNHHLNVDKCDIIIQRSIIHCQFNLQTTTTIISSTYSIC